MNFRKYKDTDYPVLTSWFETPKYVAKATNRGLLYQILSATRIMHSDYLVLEDDNHHVVAAGIARWKLGKMWLYGIRVRSDEQGKGYGRLLMIYLLDYLKKSCSVLFLKVNVNNRVAINLYESLGFVIVKSNGIQHVMKYQYK